jgi:SAM-dependent methyltransferase
MIEAAQRTYSESRHHNVTFHVQDCGIFNDEAKAKYLTGNWDKVFSNAAMHWILRRPEVRQPFFQNVYAALKPRGLFVFEQGGAGNVGEIHAALIASLIADGAMPQQAHKTSPWFFPSENWMRRALEAAGFEVLKLELEYRPTNLTPDDGKGGGGLEGWIRLFGAQFVEAARDKEGFVKRVCEIVGPLVTREEDGSMWVGYTRLRGVGRKKF